MTAITNSYVLGLNPILDNNFLLDTDGAGALRVRRRADGSGGLLLNIDATGKITLPNQPASAYSCIRLNTANGYGSTNTAIRRFSNVVLSQGTDITYSDSASMGALFTINTTGIYAISYSDQFVSAATLGMSLNSNQLTTGIGTITATDVLDLTNTAGASLSSAVTCVCVLVAGSLVRPHCSGAATGGGGAARFTITKASL